jgi:hypothetical protein
MNGSPAIGLTTGVSANNTFTLSTSSLAVSTVYTITYMCGGN